MSKKELDCRGMNCPVPVMTVRDAIKELNYDILSVLVDNDAARQNVTRFLEHEKYRVDYEKVGCDFCLTGVRGDAVFVSEKRSEVTVQEKKESMGKRIMVLVTSTHLGHGDDALGDMLMFNFIKTLKEMTPELWRLVFVNSGVSFTAEGSEALPFLQELESMGVHITACGACLAYFHILDKIKVGEVTNMLDIITAMKESDSVITV